MYEWCLNRSLAKADNKDYGWSGGGDGGLRTETGRDITEVREMINGRCIYREGLFLLPGMAGFMSL